jgi:hypothetical protein
VAESDEEKGGIGKYVPPEVLDGGEGVDGSDGTPPGGLLGLPLRVIEPEGPRVLEWVLGWDWRRVRAVVVVGDLALLPVVVVLRGGAAPRAGGGGPGVGVLGGHGGAVRVCFFFEGGEGLLGRRCVERDREEERFVMLPCDRRR